MYMFLIWFFNVETNTNVLWVFVSNENDGI